MRRALLRRARRRTAALRRRIQFSLGNLSSGGRIYGRIRVRHGGIRSARGTRRDGVWDIFQWSFRRRFTRDAVIRRCLAGHGVSPWESADRQRVPERFYAGKIALDRCTDRGGLLCNTEAADQFFARGWGQILDPERRIRDRARLCHVFVLRLECRGVHHERD